MSLNYFASGSIQTLFISVFVVLLLLLPELLTSMVQVLIFAMTSKLGFVASRSQDYCSIPFHEWCHFVLAHLCRNDTSFLKLSFSLTESAACGSNKRFGCVLPAASSIATVLSPFVADSYVPVAELIKMAESKTLLSSLRSGKLFRQQVLHIGWKPTENFPVESHLLIDLFFFAQNLLKIMQYYPVFPSQKWRKWESFEFYHKGVLLRGRFCDIF